MTDDIARARRATQLFEDASARHGTASRRWTESADEARVQVDDAAGRALQQRWLDPYQPMMDGLSAGAQRALDGQQRALDQATRAVDAANRAAEAVMRATSGVRQSQAQAHTAQAEIGTALSESATTHHHAAEIAARVASLG